MANIEAFRGIRYDLGHVGALSDVIAPPYDVIDSALQDVLYEQHPANIIRLILNRDEPGDSDPDQRYQRAAKYLKQWQKEGVLCAEADPAIYVYHQVFEDAGVTYTRRGFMSRVRLEPFGEGTIYPHEQTHAAAKADRLKLTKACKANLSQIFAIYPDSENVAQETLENAILGKNPYQATDHLGITHRIWPVTDEMVIGSVTEAMSGKPLYVADGHHRYETACNYRQQQEADGKIGPHDPANFVLTMCVSMHDPGMIVLPTHRLFQGFKPLDSATLVNILEGAFECQVLGTGPHLANEVWDSIEQEAEQGQLGFYCPVDQTWVLSRITATGRQRMAEVAADQTSDWQGLGVSILHRLVMETLLQHQDLPKPTYVHQVEEVITELEQDETDDYSLAALVMPATLDHIRQISEAGERMPAKSTYFYPKLLSGLVIHSLD
jgi:uncharacterized protein (DUF1015 family)